MDVFHQPSNTAVEGVGEGNVFLLPPPASATPAAYRRVVVVVVIGGVGGVGGVAVAVAGWTKPVSLECSAAAAGLNVVTVLPV